MTIPKFVSDSCKSFLKQILNTNPDDRLNITQIRAHKWYNIVDQVMPPKEGIIVGINSIPVSLSSNLLLLPLQIEKDIIRLMQSKRYGSHKETVIRKSIE